MSPALEVSKEGLVVALRALGWGEGGRHSQAESMTLEIFFYLNDSMILWISGSKLGLFFGDIFSRIPQEVSSQQTVHGGSWKPLAPVCFFIWIIPAFWTNLPPNKLAGMEGKRLFLQVLYKIILRYPGLWDDAGIPGFLPGHEELWAGIWREELEGRSRCSGHTTVTLIGTAVLQDPVCSLEIDAYYN